MTDAVLAEVRYLDETWRNRDERPFIFSRETRHKNTIKHEVPITNARPMVADGSIDFDKNGFTLHSFDHGVTDWNSNAQVLATYADMIVPMLKSLTDCEDAFVMGHQVRNENPETFLGAYSRYVHCDYPLHPMHEREAGLLKRYESSLADEIEDRDYIWYNIWAPIERVAEQNQLCIVDAASARLADFREYHFSPKAEGGYATLPLYNPNHRFYYFDDMQTDECIVFKQYDSRADKPMVCPHTSFFDIHKGERASRRSVEYRALCII